MPHLYMGRTPSGLWKLNVFYMGIRAAISQVPEPGSRFFAGLESKTKAWSEAYPASPSAHIAHSMVLLEHGWYFRGTGYASSVPPEAWEPFRRYVKLARENLERHKAIAAVDPGWYEAMLTVARAEGWNRREFDALLNEALDREPYSYHTYFAAVEYLLPHWQGSAEEVEQFAQQAVARTRAQEGESLYARIYWAASQGFGNDLLFRSSTVWPRMKAGFEDVIARYPDVWNVNNYARFSCLAGDKQKARQLLTKIQAAPVVEAWQPVSLFVRCQRWAFGQ